MTDPTTDYAQHHRHILEWRKGKRTGVLFQVCTICTTVVEWGEPTTKVKQ